MTRLGRALPGKPKTCNLGSSGKSGQGLYQGGTVLAGTRVHEGREAVMPDLCIFGCIADCNGSYILHGGSLEWPI